MRTLYFHNSISVRQILFLWLTLCLLPGIAQATGSHHHDRDYGENEYTESDNKDCDNTLTVRLFTNDKIQVGVVKVSFDEYNLNVKYIVNDGWLIEKTQLAVADSFEGLPQDRYGNPKLRRFPLQTYHKSPVSVVNQMLSTSQWPLGTELFIAAHADVVALKPMHNGKKRFKATSVSGKWNKSLKVVSEKHAKTNDHHETSDDEEKQSQYHSFKRFSEKFFNRYESDDNHRHTIACRGDDKHQDRKKSGAKSRSAWAKNLSFPGSKGGFYFTYLLKTCEPPADSTIQFSAPVYFSTEDETSALVTVTRSGADLSTPAIVRMITTDGTAQAGIDYGMIDQQLIFAPNETQVNVLIPVIDDSEAEETETVNLQLLEVQGASLGEQDTAALEIADNETPVFIFEPADYSVVEPDRGNSVDVTISVKRLGSLNDFSSVDVVIIGGSANSRDYRFMPGTLEFPAGEATPTEPATIVIVGDNTGEADETILFGFGGPVNGQIGEPSQAELMIIDNDGN
ncbi:Calx-beta domain-containing protein [Kaarinaea lacus]